MKLMIYIDTPFNDASAMADFFGAHAQAHETITRVLVKGGKEVTVRPLADLPMDNRDWLYDHYEMHTSIGKATGTSVPDLSVVDWNDAAQVKDWMNVHALIHENIDTKLGITT